MSAGTAPWAGIKVVEECAEFMWKSAACRADKATKVAELTTPEIEDGEGGLVHSRSFIEASQGSQVDEKDAMAVIEFEALTDD